MTIEPLTVKNNFSRTGTGCGNSPIINADLQDLCDAEFSKTDMHSIVND
jgi:hypothetical protein